MTRSQTIATTIADAAVELRQVAELLDTIVDAQPDSAGSGQLVDSLTAVGRLIRVTTDKLAALDA